MKEKLFFILFIIVLCVVILITLEHKHGFLKPKISDDTMVMLKPEKIEQTKPKEEQKIEQEILTVKIERPIELVEVVEEVEIVEEDILAGSLEFGEEDALMLHKISIAEAGGESVESMALVMLVVLNRTNSESFPDTIEEVIFQRVNNVAQFTPTKDGGYNKVEPNEKSKKAMELVLSGWDESQNALYFEACKGKSWHSKNLDLLFEKDGIRFYKEKQ